MAVETDVPTKLVEMAITKPDNILQDFDMDKIAEIVYYIDT